MRLTPMQLKVTVLKYCNAVFTEKTIMIGLLERILSVQAASQLSMMTNRQTDTDQQNWYNNIARQ